MNMMKKYAAMASMMAALALSVEVSNPTRRGVFANKPPLSNKQKKSRAAAKRARKARRK
jgi:hypothetical protein